MKNSEWVAVFLLAIAMILIVIGAFAIHAGLGVIALGTCIGFIATAITDG